MIRTLPGEQPGRPKSLIDQRLVNQLVALNNKALGVMVSTVYDHLLKAVWGCFLWTAIDQRYPLRRSTESIPLTTPPGLVTQFTTNPMSREG